MLDEPKFHFQHFVNEGGEGRADVRCSLDSFIEASKWTSFFNSPVHSCDDDDDDNFFSFFGFKHLIMFGLKFW